MTFYFPVLDFLDFLQRCDEWGRVYIVLCYAAAGVGIVEGGIAIVAYGA